MISFFVYLKISILVILLIPNRVLSLICSRYPANTNTAKSPVDENFVVSISGNPQTYILGQEYTVSLNAYNGRRFVSFKLALENDNGDALFSDDLGRFEVTDSVETRYSPYCINMVESTNPNPKTRVSVNWVAPSQPGSGCVLLRATLVQHRDVWYMDDGGLTKRICEEVTDDTESQKPADERRTCCACDEARYELTFEGLWSRNLHPKDFPPKGWLTRFSDIVGAAHTDDYSFWQNGELVSEGMREFAEYGVSRTLEEEFSSNFKDGKIRTVIKARGPAFPNLNGQSVASIRVDPQHHLVSLASKVMPSPDWFVGVANLELCLANCTWLEQRLINLYPWDAGTDAGPSYTSPDQPQVPPDVVRRMRSDFPNDPRSPFYDESGAPMKPLASLTLRRKRLYERACDRENANSNDASRECATHPWSAWSQCSSSCGEGRQYRTRFYKQPEVARIYKCEALLRQERECRGRNCGSPARNQNFRGHRMEEEEDVSIGQDELPPIDEQNPYEANGYDANGVDGQNEETNDPFYGEADQGGDNWHQDDKDNQYEPYEQARYPYEQEENPQNPEAEEESNNNIDFNAEEAGDENENREEEENQDLDINQRNREEEEEEEKEEDVEEQEEEYEQERDWQSNRRKQNQWSNRRRPADRRRPYNQEQQPPSDNDEKEPEIPDHCLQRLQIVPCPQDPAVTRHYWFYNYCEDTCMLYAADVCDANVNRFNAMEECEESCRQPEYAPIIRQKQMTECRRGRRRRPNNRRRP